jgi:site-specific recombinase XerD
MGRITIGKDMVQFSCKLEANPELWDTRAGRVNGKSRHARTVNGEIDKINVAVTGKYREIMSVRGQTTANEVKNAYQGNALIQETLLKVFLEHNETFEKRVGVNRAIRTFWNYRTGYKTLERFIKQKYNVSDLSFRQLDYAFIENYDYHLRIDCKMLPRTVLQKMMCLQKMVKIAIGKGIINHNPFTGYSPERPKTVQRYVPSEELEKLRETCLNNSSLDLTRDMFVFSCYTGLSYVDLYNLTHQQIVKADDGTLWLNISRRKNENVSKIPLLDPAFRLIEKYKDSANGDKVFQLKTCSHMNEQLKKIAELCGIDRRLTFHMSRHTFATETCLSQGVPIETVMRMMGHKLLSTTQIYAKVTHNKVNEDMVALSDKLNYKYAFV